MTGGGCRSGTEVGAVLAPGCKCRRGRRPYPWLILAVLLCLPSSAGRKGTPSNSTSPSEKGGGRGKGLPVQPVDGEEEDDHHVVLIEAGGNQTVAHVYSYSWHAGRAYPEVSLPGKTHSVGINISSLAASPANLGTVLDPLLAFALETVPSDRHQITPLLMVATVASLQGMQREASGKLLDACFARIKEGAGGLVVQREWVERVGPRMQGGLLWLATNFAQKRLKGMKFHHRGTVSCVSMGPQTVQAVVALSADEEEEGELKLPLGSSSISLYSINYNFVGMEAAKLKYKLRHRSSPSMRGWRDPCLRAGTSALGARGVGHYVRCEELAAKLLSRGGGCDIPPCSIDGIHLPDILSAADAGGIVLANELHTTFQDLGLDHRGATLSQVQKAGAQRCAGKLPNPPASEVAKDTNGAEQKERERVGGSAIGSNSSAGERRLVDKWRRKGGSKKDNKRDNRAKAVAGADDSCFRTAYSVALLTTGLNLPLSARVQTLPRHFGGPYSIDWPLGKLLQFVLDPRMVDSEASLDHSLTQGLRALGWHGGGGKKKKEGGEYRAMVMALVCGILFVTTLAVQQPVKTVAGKGDATQGESSAHSSASKAEEGMAAAEVLTPERAGRPNMQGAGAKKSGVRSVRKGGGGRAASGE